MVRSATGLPKATIDDVPPELIDRFCSYSDVATLKSLRLSNKTLNASATRALFRTVELLPTEASANKCEAILESEPLRKLVGHIAVNTSLTPEDEDPYADDGWPKERVLPAAFEAMITKICYFEKLSDVSLRFSSLCKGSEDTHGYVRPGVPETVELRHAVLKKFLFGVSGKENSTKLATLTIKNLQNLLTDAITERPEFVSMLSGLYSLSLRIVSEITDYPESDDLCPEPHQFFGHDLSNKILNPAVNNLRYLKLYSNGYWGYSPFCNLIDLHFPNLRSLALGNYTFFCNAQLDWLVSHADTLQSLILDDCAILPAGRIYPEDASNHPPQGPDLRPEEERHMTDAERDLTWEYALRWHDYFKVFEAKLHQLLHLGFGHGAWDRGQEFEESDQVKNELRQNRYLVYDCGTLPSHIGEPYERSTRMGNVEPRGFDCCWDAPPAPQCDVEDRMTLNQLLDTIRRRKGGSDLQIVEPDDLRVDETWTEKAEDAETIRIREAIARGEWAHWP